jgi:hypothetical protein
MDTVRNSPRELKRRSEEVARRARAIIEKQLHLAGRAGNFDFELRDDVLIVRGTVPSFYLKQVLQNALKNLEGVRWIDNQVTVAVADGQNGRDNALT